MPRPSYPEESTEHARIVAGVTFLNQTPQRCGIRSAMFKVHRRQYHRHLQASLAKYVRREETPIALPVPLLGGPGQDPNAERVSEPAALVHILPVAFGRGPSAVALCHRLPIERLTGGLQFE